MIIYVSTVCSQDLHLPGKKLTGMRMGQVSHVSTIIGCLTFVKYFFNALKCDWTCNRAEE